MQNAGMHGSTPGTGPTDYGSENALNDTNAKLQNLSQSAQQTVEHLTAAASQAAARLSERGRDLWEAQQPNIERARGYMREHPVATVGIAVAIGLILSRLLSRR